MSPLNYDDYKSYLKDLILFNKGTRGFQKKLAEAAGCQSSYLSKALSEHVHLTPDHLAGICEYLRLKGEESDYILELLALERAAHPALKRRCEERIRKLKHAFERVDRNVTGKVIDGVDATYYSSWIYQAVHMATSIPELGTPRMIAKRLSIDTDKALNILRSLEGMGLVHQVGGKWEITETSTHLPMDSPLTSMNHLNWRNLAGLDIQKSSLNSIHYSSIHSLSKRDIAHLRGKILSFIRESQDIVAASPEEDLVCVGIDYFIP